MNEKISFKKWSKKNLIELLEYIEYRFPYFFKLLEEFEKIKKGD